MQPHTVFVNLTMKTSLPVLVSIFIIVDSFICVANAQNCGFGDYYEGGESTTFQPAEDWRTTTSWALAPVADVESRRKNNSYFDKSATGSSSSPRTLYFNIRETQSTEIPFATVEAYDIIWAHPRTTHIRIEIDEADQMARFYVTPSFRHFIDTEREYYFYRVEVHLRCTDGMRSEHIDVSIIDQNTQAPKFSPSRMQLTVPQNWPTLIPINLQNPIFVRDADYSLNYAQVTLSASPDIVRALLTPLFAGQHAYPYDYKVELFLTDEANAGSYNVWLSASDGIHVTPYSIALTVTDIVCKGQKIDPVFGWKGKTNKILYYNSTLSTVPEEGDALPGVVIQAFNPEDDACSIELSISNMDYLTVSSSTGEVTFTRTLTLSELEGLGRTWIVEVVATDAEAGKSTTVPLVITNDFETIHASI